MGGDFRFFLNLPSLCSRLDLLAFIARETGDTGEICTGGSE